MAQTMLHEQGGKAGKRGIDLTKTVPVRLGPATEDQISEMALRLMPQSRSHMFTGEIGRILAAQKLDIRQSHKKLLEMKTVFDEVASSPAAVKSGGMGQFMDNAPGDFHTNFARLLALHPGFVVQLAKQTDFFEAEDQLYKNGILGYLVNHPKDAGWVAKSGPIKTRFLLLSKKPQLAGIMGREEFGDAMIKNPQATCQALEWILQQCASRGKQGQGIISALADLLPSREPSFSDDPGFLFANDPGLFARNIVKLGDALNPILSTKEIGYNWSGYNWWHGAQYIFTAPSLAKKFFKDPDRTLQDILGYVEALSGKSAETRLSVRDAFASLGGPIGNELAASPEAAIRIAKHLGSASPDMPFLAISIVSYDGTGALFSAYKKSPDRIISALSSIHQSTYDKAQGYDSGLYWVSSSKKSLSFFSARGRLRSANTSARSFASMPCMPLTTAMVPRGSFARCSMYRFALRSNSRMKLSAFAPSSCAAITYRRESAENRAGRMSLPMLYSMENVNDASRSDVLR